MAEQYGALAAAVSESDDPIVRYEREIDGPGQRRLRSDDFTHAPWESATLGRANLLLAVDALKIRQTADR